MKRLADRRQRRVRRVGFWAAVTAIAAYLLFVGDQRPHHLLLLWLEDRRTEERIEELADERDALRAEVARLEGDTLALESLARAKGMIRPGDLVYRIVPVPPDVREAAAESLAARAARIAADSLAREREAEERERAARSEPVVRPELPAPIREREAPPIEPGPGTVSSSPTEPDGASGLPSEDPSPGAAARDSTLP
ncbi:MAG: septum formation initiator family protein [Gemmatimonadota bacterium]|nr:septum formation initiator family protein [Gemmatimonadota bacterium]